MSTLHSQKVIPDNVLVQKLVPAYEGLQKQFNILCSSGFFEINPEILRSHENRETIVDIIRGFSNCCDNILSVFTSVK
ncbi:MAG: hypothetical protein LBI03_04360 [Clostridiales bacterium]|jgi:hypothetical protein|nr:hypothetical protein [Clostridiales bacterium]